jgi:hypothetical protein
VGNNNQEECGASKYWPKGGCVRRSCEGGHTSICSKLKGHGGKHREDYGGKHEW